MLEQLAPGLPLPAAVERFILPPKGCSVRKKGVENTASKPWSALVTDRTAAIADGVRRRFEQAREARAHAGETVAAGREFVAAYVQFTHYVEGLEALAAGHAAEHGVASRH